jgi:hypothetical protein
MLRRVLTFCDCRYGAEEEKINAGLLTPGTKLPKYAQKILDACLSESYAKLCSHEKGKTSQERRYFY